MTERKVCLDGMEGVALLLPGPSGVVYWNQVGGTRCEHPEVEAFLIPLGTGWPIELKEHRLEHLLDRAAHDTWELSVEQADRIDAIFQKYESTQCIRVDRNRITESMEAWVHVNVVEEPNAPFDGFGQSPGIVTWMNSD